MCSRSLTSDIRTSESCNFCDFPKPTVWHSRPLSTVTVQVFGGVNVVPSLELSFILYTSSSVTFICTNECNAMNVSTERPSSTICWIRRVSLLSMLAGFSPHVRVWEQLQTLKSPLLDNKYVLAFITWSQIPTWGCVRTKLKVVECWNRGVKRVTNWVYLSSRWSRWAPKALCQLSQFVKTIFKEPLRFCLVCNLKNV